MGIARAGRGGLRSVPRRRRAYRAARGGCPRATRIARRALSTHVSHSLEHLACDDELLDLRRPLVDLRDLGVAEVALYLGLANEAVAAVHLHGVGGHLHRRLGLEWLGQRSLIRIRAYGIHATCFH